MPQQTLPGWAGGLDGFGGLNGQIVLKFKCRAVLRGVVEQVLQIGGANVQEGGWFDGV